MSKITLNTIGSRYGGIDALNDNFAAIEAAFENTLSRDGTTPNSLEANLDANGNSLLNVENISMTGDLTLNGIDYLAQVELAAAGAETSQNAAAASATSAASSATSSSSSATAAAGSASNASSSATAAANSATSAAASATSAQEYAGTAGTLASSASTSAISATASASTATTKAAEAATSASNASTSATNAATSATSASNSASSASTSASSAASSAAAALAALDSFDDRYLGQKATPPTLDNDGNALIVGALYFNTSGLGMQVWDGTVWVALYSMGGGTVTAVSGTAPVTSTGGATPAIGLAASYGDTQNPYASKTAKYVLAAPNGAAGVPTFRALVASDIPTLNQNTTGTAANVTGTVAIANGGTGATTRQEAMDALAGAVTSGQYLRGNGTDVVMSAIQAADVPTLNQNTTGTAANVTGTVAIANGGTGATTAATARTNLGATTVGGNLLTLANPSAVTFPRVNADNTVSTLDAATFRTAIGAGAGTVTGVTATAPVASSGGTAPAISLAAAYGDTLNPYASKTANYILAAPNGAAGVPTFRAIVAADIPTLNQNTTGSAATLTTARTLWGQSFNGSANITGALSSVTTLAMSGQLTNTVAIGTAPMVVTSTTRVANLNVATAGTADTLTTARTINGTSFNGSANITVPVTMADKSDNTTYQIPFMDGGAASTKSLYRDSLGALQYNPSTDTLIVPNITGTASLASLANYAQTGLRWNSTNYAFDTAYGPGTNSGDDEKVLTSEWDGTAVKLRWKAPAATGITGLTSVDGSVIITDNGDGTLDLAAVGGGGGASWYTIQSGALGNLANDLAMPGSWTATPTGTSGSLFAGASSVNGGASWATGLTGPAWSSSTSYGGWGSSNSPYYSNYANWGFGVTDPEAVWMIPPTAGFVFCYLQYPPQSTNTNLYDAWGNATGWNGSFGSSFSNMSMSSVGSTRNYYLVLVISGNQTVTANGALMGVTLDTAYDSWSNTTYVFFNCTDDASVGNLLTGSNAVSWGSSNSYYGHAWYEYT